MKRLLFILPVLITCFLHSDEKESHLYGSYLWNSNGVNMPCIGYQYEKGIEKFDFFVGYTPLKSWRTYHYSIASFNTGISLLQTEETDVYLKAGIKLTNLYCKKDEAFKNSRLLIYPQIGVGAKINTSLRLELFYHPFLLSNGRSHVEHSSYFRIVFTPS